MPKFEGRVFKASHLRSYIAACGVMCAAFGAVMGSAPVYAQQDAPARVTKPNTVPMYQPPARGAPGGRIGGSTRGTMGDTPMISVLAPDHTGLTTSDQPVLYWYISAPAKSLKLEVSVLRDAADEPALEVATANEIKEGIHAIRLADHNVRLTPDKEYEWSVSLVVDPENRSKDIFARGLVMHVRPNADAEKAASAAADQKPALYAAQGLWYDALKASSDLVEQNPGNASYREQRAQLLDQIGLPAAAAFARQ